MKQKYQILISITILALLTSVSIATTEQNSTNTTEKISDVNINTTEKISDVNINTTEKISDVNINTTETDINISADINLPASPTIASAYTNPISGISIFGTTFGVGIPDGNLRDWTSYSFYLPAAAYVYIDISGSIGQVDDIFYMMSVDNIQNSPWTIERDDNAYERQDAGLQKSQIFYLTKGYHNVYLRGRGLTDGAFTIYGFISVMAFPEYTAITVTSPNGGENWTKGTTKTISWKKDGNPGANVRIDLYKAGILSNVISSNTPNDGSYSWYIPTYQPIGSDYKIKITSTSDSKYNDWSDNYFRIY